MDQTIEPDWIDRIHARLLVRYGTAWIRKYAGIEPEVVKDDWERELQAYRMNPRAIWHALEHLPADLPPNATQFAQLCRGVPVVNMRRLPAPVGSSARRAEVVAAAHQIVHTPGTAVRGSVVERLRQDQANGKKLTQFQRILLREDEARSAGRTPA